MKFAVAGFVAIAAVVVQKRKHPSDFTELLEMAELGQKLFVIVGRRGHADIMRYAEQGRKRKIMLL